MKKVSLFVLVLSCVGVVAACSDDDASSGGGASACKPSNGQYKVKYTKDSSSTGTCPDIPETTITISDSTGDGGTGSTTPGCTTSTDTSSCTNTTKCSNTQSGMTVESNSTTKFSGGSVSGSTETKTTGSPGGAADSDCKYTFTWTKQ